MDMARHTADHPKSRRFSISSAASNIQGWFLLVAVLSLLSGWTYTSIVFDNTQYVGEVDAEGFVEGFSNGFLSNHSETGASKTYVASDRSNAMTITPDPRVVYLHKERETQFNNELKTF